MKKTCNNSLTIVIIGAIICFIIIGLIIGNYKAGYKTGYNDCLTELKDKYSSPVENNKIDTCYIVRDSLIYRTKYITQIQYDTITKVYFLDDSTTVKLFYQLVSER